MTNYAKFLCGPPVRGSTVILLPEVKRIKWWLALLNAVIAFTVYSLIRSRAGWSTPEYVLDVLYAPAVLIFTNGVASFAELCWRYLGVGSFPSSTVSTTTAVIVGVAVLWFLVGHLIELQVTKRTESAFRRFTRNGVIIGLGFLIGPVWGSPGIQIAPYGVIKPMNLGLLLWFILLVAYGCIDLYRGFGGQLNTPVSLGGGWQDFSSLQNLRVYHQRSPRSLAAKP
jgi:hypothetical protein